MSARTQFLGCPDPQPTDRENTTGALSLIKALWSWLVWKLFGIDLDDYEPDGN